MQSSRTVHLDARVWISCIQFFIVQCIVASAWRTPYSNSANFISDLGAVTCGNYPLGSTNYVCSPWHAAINISMILQGVIFITGALRWNPQPHTNRGIAYTVRILIVLAGFGSSIVGIFPEDIAALAHYFGAGLHLISGNLGLLALGCAIKPATRRWRGLRSLAFLCGAIGTLATILLATGHVAGLGIGGMERAAVYPLPICLIAFGLQTDRDTRIVNANRL